MDASRFERTVREECRLESGRIVIAGVSGGPDSLCMLHLLVKHGLPVVVAHFDHSLRTESAADAQHVREIAESLGIPFVLEKLDVRNYAKQSKISIEEASRLARYQFLFKEAQRMSAQAVAVAHTADDQVETVLMHLLRGAGLSGLKGMEHRCVMPVWDQNIPLVRPLLDFWRQDVLEYCNQFNLQPVFDASNMDTTYYRNRIRHELIPYLEEYNPHIRRGIWRMAETLAGDYEVLNEQIEKTWLRCCVKDQEHQVILAATELIKLPVGLQRSLLRYGVEQFRPGLRDVDFEMIERGIDFIHNPTRTHQIDLGANLCLSQEGDLLFLSKWGEQTADEEWPTAPKGVNLELSIHGIIQLNQTWWLEAEWADFSGNENVKITDPYHTWLDGELLIFPLVIRGHNPGDRFQPLGMKGHSMKVSDFFINEGLSRRLRDQWPLLWSGNKIAWIPGFRPAEFCRLSQSSRKVIHLNLYRRG